MIRQLDFLINRMAPVGTLVVEQVNNRAVLGRLAA
jgi:hypothetical protein